VQNFDGIGSTSVRRMPASEQIAAQPHNPRFAMREPNEFQLKLLEQIECKAAKYLSSSSGSLLAVSAET
jgi:hypothetical protein